MLNKIYDVVKDYSLIGVVMSVIIALIKPFVSLKQTIRDSAITFIISVMCGLLLEYIDIPYTVKVGISSVFGLFAVRIYEIIESILFKIEKNPDIIIDKLKKND